MAIASVRNSLQKHIPFLMFKTLSADSWLTTGNTHTVNDEDVRENSLILIEHTSQHAGRWFISTKSSGSFVITSSDVETAGATFNYIIL